MTQRYTKVVLDGSKEKPYKPMPKDKPPRRSTNNESDTREYRREYQREYRAENGNGYIPKKSDETNSAEHAEIEVLVKALEDAHGVLAHLGSVGVPEVVSDRDKRSINRVRRSAVQLGFDIATVVDLLTSVQDKDVTEVQEDDNSNRF